MTDRPAEENGSDTPGSRPPTGLPAPFYNWMSVIGGVIMVISATTTVFFVIVDVATDIGGDYTGLLLIIPFGLTGIGLALLLAGSWRERRRQKRGVHSSFLERTVINPYQLVSRASVASILAGLVAATGVLLGISLGTVEAVEYSESNEFCGTTCHAVMGPEDTTYHDSPHAKIDCVTCHVGPGSDAYLRAKIGGMRQLYKVATGTWSRPIPTPIHGLRLSDEMCSTCHNRERFVGYKALTATYFSAGEDTTPSSLSMLMKVGGGNDQLMPGGGIHYHMLLAKKVEYVARDPQRQDIAWVRVVRADGEAVEYENTDAPLTDDERASLPIREMECLDCHSRPAHRFPSPVSSVNQALASGAIPAEIPYIKEAAVRALDADYESTPAALAGIETNLQAFYEEQDEDVLEEQSEQLATATAALRHIYSRTIFPEMKTDWRAHPDNSGHLDTPGCFRCHNDSMVDAEGEAIFSDCVSCHAVLAQDDDSIGSISDIDRGREFVHPEDGGTFDEFTLCSECHTGGSALYD